MKYYSSSFLYPFASGSWTPNSILTSLLFTVVLDPTGNWLAFAVDSGLMKLRDLYRCSSTQSSGMAPDWTF